MTNGHLRTQATASPLSGAVLQGGAGTPLLRTEGLTKHYPGVDALVDVDFELAAGEVHALFGENGAGKSTLISILAGANRPTRGQVYANGTPVDFAGVREARAHGISAVFQEFSLVPQLTVAENLFLGAEPTRHGLLDRGGEIKRAQELLERLGFPLPASRQVQFLSRAEQQMVEIAKAFRSDLSVLILDEPTASLTERETDSLFALIAQAKARGVGIIYITHRILEIRRIADRVTALRDGRKVGMLKAADADEATLIQMMSGRPISQIFPKVKYAPGDALLRAERITTRDGDVRDVSIEVRAGEIVGIAGLVGCGKSEVARACFGLLPLSKGKVSFAGEDVTGATPRQMLDRGLSYLPPDRHKEGLVLSRSSVENVSLPALHLGAFSSGIFLKRRSERQAVSNVVRDLQLHPFDVDREVGTFSGGNQQKVLIGKMLTREVRMFVFDEPTVGVDVSTRVSIYQLIAQLCEGGAGVLLVSSDLPEILHLCNRAYVMFRGHVQVELQEGQITEDRVLSHFFERAA
ncbi:MAG TPA: sugar ABC transporter ATP-binding protein [Dongiaceae bacterium]|nr:sugar ABC transporter ATP-binding protein [Dongiaceae bacterium]